MRRQRETRWVTMALGILAVLLGSASRPVYAQSISPVIGEYRGKSGSKARGSFELKTNSLFCFSVVLEPMSFSVDGDGNPRYRRLDPGLQFAFRRGVFASRPSKVTQCTSKASWSNRPHSSRFA